MRGGRRSIDHRDARKPKVLIVDAYRDGREMIAYYLRSIGFDTLEAGSGAEALEQARHCDVALIDLVLPKVSGLDLAAQLKSAPETARVAVIIYTKWVTQEARVLAAAAGLPLLPKSTDLKVLAEELLQAFHRVAA